MPVKCISQEAKESIAHAYAQGNVMIKDIANFYKVSCRTVNRILIEFNLATPVERIQEDAARVMRALKKYGHTPESIEALMEKTSNLRKRIHAYSSGVIVDTHSQLPE